MRAPRLVLLLLALAVAPLLAACSTGGTSPPDDPTATDPGDSTGDPTPPAPTPPPPVGGSTTTAPSVAPGSAPPVGVTWHIGITENVPLATMQAVYASWVTVNNALWNLSEGQVRIDTIRLYDAVGVGVSASQFAFGGGGINTSNLDIVTFPPQSWDIQAGGAVATQPGVGRTGRLMIIPTNAAPFVGLHEGSHLVFQLSWSGGPLLLDEYQDGTQDPACVMESENLPRRWCSDANHVSQASQPHACWHQILLDYPAFTHTGTETTSHLPPAPTAEYHDTP